MKRNSLGETNSSKKNREKDGMERIGFFRKKDNKRPVSDVFPKHSSAQREAELSNLLIDLAIAALEQVPDEAVQSCVENSNINCNDINKEEPNSHENSGFMPGLSGGPGLQS